MSAKPLTGTVLGGGAEIDNHHLPVQSYRFPLQIQTVLEKIHSRNKTHHLFMLFSAKNDISHTPYIIICIQYCSTVDLSAKADRHNKGTFQSGQAQISTRVSDSLESYIECIR